MQFNPIHHRKQLKKGAMQAQDLFRDKLRQVFSRETGEYLGYIYEGQDPEILQEKIEAQPDPIPRKRDNQLNLFDLTIL